MKKCAKCDNRLEGGARVIAGGESYSFCQFCSGILENAPSHIVHLFLQKDASSYEEIPMTFVQRNMLQAKEQRKQGNSSWSKK